MEKNQYWICPECGSEVDMDKNGCWRCRFVADDVSKYKRNKKAYFLSNFKIMAIVATSLCASLALSVFLIIYADNHYVEKQTRIAMEQKALKEQQLREYEERMNERKRESEEQHRQMINKRFQSKQNDALQKISNLENQYNSLLSDYGSVLGNVNAEVRVMKKLIRTLEEINDIADKELLIDKKIKNVQGKIKSDLLQRYGRM